VKVAEGADFVAMLVEMVAEFGPEGLDLYTLASDLFEMDYSSEDHPNLAICREALETATADGRLVYDAAEDRWTAWVPAE
jgi:hypothetical protein